MRRDLWKGPFKSSFLSIEKDTETIIRKLFVESKPHSDELKRLLVCNGNDCLDHPDNPVYKELVAKANPGWLKENGYIVTKPKLNFAEFEEKKSVIIITFDNFVRNATNFEFRDCNVIIDVLSHIDTWDLGDYRLRPLKIAGYIDGILDGNRLSGIGTFQFAGCSMLNLSPEYSGYTLIYNAVHGSDDEIRPPKE